MRDRNERTLGRPARGRRGITVLTLVLLIIAVAVAAVLLTRTLAH
jgi:flagellar basal body-associated protein FliL